jgi:hypothetical protein
VHLDVPAPGRPGDPDCGMSVDEVVDPEDFGVVWKHHYSSRER